ncbi:MAG: response regulator [Deltaproteobacteria bacterium]|nr:response regulator [Deltaproteobacteria bacterium]
MEQDILEGKRILVVDDEHDVLDTVEDLLSMCEVTTASDFGRARDLLEADTFDLALLDIMGVDGYGLLELAVEKGIPAVMLTAHALSLDNIKKSREMGASYFIPKEEMVHLTTFLRDIFEARAKGRNPWVRWYQRLASFCERRFGPDWKEPDKAFWDRMTYH